jgi:amidase
MAEIQFSTAGELAAKIRTGSVTSREVTEQLLTHVAADSAVNAVIDVRREPALR